MADCNHLFHHYNSAIRLDNEKRKVLINERNALRQRMQQGFLQLPEAQRNGHILEHYSQGSFEMDTIITPLNDDYDLDDGVYFRGYLKPAQRPESSFFHNLVIASIKSPGDFKSINDRDTCVRVDYNSGFHIDLPIYYAEHHDCPDLAHIKKGWILS